MTYQIRITERAQTDMMRAADHIAYVLKNPRAADALLDETAAEINSLATMPQRYALAGDRVLASWGIRFLRIKNYLVFYTVDETTCTVFIVRFLYGKSNWAAILRGNE